MQQELLPKPGVYIISTGNTFYVGSSHSVKSRISNHKSLLKTNKHFCRRMQHIYNKYGVETFSFDVLEYTGNVKNLIDAEQKWLNILFESVNVKHIFNSRRIAERNTGVKFTEETRQNISNALKGRSLGRKASDEQRLNMSKALKGVPKNLSEKEKARRKALSDATKEKQLAERRAKREQKPKYTLYDPDGNKYTDIIDLNQFCIAKSLCTSSIIKVLKGYRKHHNYWTSDFNAIPRYTFISPDGEIHTNVYDIPKFAKEHNLKKNSVYQLCYNRDKVLHGWRIYDDTSAQ